MKTPKPKPQAKPQPKPLRRKRQDRAEQRFMVEQWKAQGLVRRRIRPGDPWYALFRMSQISWGDPLPYGWFEPD